MRIGPFLIVSYLQVKNTQKLAIKTHYSMVPDKIVIEICKTIFVFVLYVTCVKCEEIEPSFVSLYH